MIDKLQWFKFSPSSWMMGRIQRCDDVAQGRFIRLCCTYWNHKCTLEIEEAEIELGEDAFRELLKLKIIKTDGDYLEIDFLDDQYKDIEETTDKRSENGLIGNLKRWHKPIYDKFMKGEIDLKTAISIAKQSPPDGAPIAIQSQSIAEERREEKKRKDINAFSFSKSLIELGAEKELVSDFLKVRKTKRLTNTKTAFDNFLGEVKKSSKSLNEVLTKCCEKSWGGFEADWINGKIIEETALKGKNGFKF
ncbi:MAG: hypothetical protein ACI9M3_001973 [Bacteroidia bacterium]|jgi:hypothetical protein